MSGEQGDDSSDWGLIEIGLVVLGVVGVAYLLSGSRRNKQARQSPENYHAPVATLPERTYTTIPFVSCRSDEEHDEPGMHKCGCCGRPTNSGVYYCILCDD